MHGPGRPVGALTLLLIVPSSETKRPPPETGDPVDIEALSFPELNPTRRRILDALIATSGRPDAFERLGVRPRKAADVARNTWLLDAPALPVLDVYTGPFHDGLDAHRLSRAASERVQAQVVVISALWGALRPRDRIPPYRVHLFANLAGIDRLDWIWRAVLPDVLANVAGEGIVVDLRSPVSQQAGRPTGLGERTVTLKIDQGPAGHRIGDVVAKRTRGQAAHFLLESGAEPATLDELAAVLADRWPTRLEPPETRDGPWLLTLTIEA